MLTHSQRIWSLCAAGFGHWVLLVGSLGLISTAARSFAAEPPESRFRLRLYSGDYYDGLPAAVDTAGGVAWRSPHFVEPVEFPLSAVGLIQRYGPLESFPSSAPGWMAMLADGSMLAGELRGIDESRVTLANELLGELRIARSELRQLLAWGIADRDLYHGPNDLSGWTEVPTAVRPEPAGNQAAPPQPRWEMDGGQLTTRYRAQPIRGQVGIEPLSWIRIKLSWDGEPNFALSLADSQAKQLLKSSYRLEVWESYLVLLHLINGVGDLQQLKTLQPTQQEIELQIFIDQPQSRIVVCDADGQVLADAQAEGATVGEPLSCMMLENHGEALRLESLQVMRWNGVLPTRLESAPVTLRLRDGQALTGRDLVWSDELGGSLMLTGQRSESDSETPPSPLKADVIDAVEFAVAPAVEASAELMRLVISGGQRLVGRLESLDDGQVVIRSSALESPLAIPLSGLVSISNPSAAGVEVSPRQGFQHLLVADGLHSLGRLVAGPIRSGAPGGLRFEPHAARQPLWLRQDVSGRIEVLAEGEPAAEAARGGQRLSGRPQRVEARRVEARRAAPAAAAVRPGRPTGELDYRKLDLPPRPTLALHNGDLLDIEPDSIRWRADQLQFVSSQVASRSISAEQVKAVFLDVRTLPDLDPRQWERLLMLPRVQRGNPPTHLVISADGDYLRGRVLQLDEEYLTLELRLEPVTIPRRLVAAVISLSERVGAAAEEATDGMQVQAVTRDGGRWTLRVTDIDQEHLVGSNLLLDGIRLEIGSLDRLLLNAAIGADLKQAGAGSGMAFFGWSLRDAPDPQVFADAAADQADAAGGDRQPTGGTASRLVGQPAPDFELPLLDGGNFRLQDQLGKIVILDFWATWCGPCIQTMPEVERIVEQLDNPLIRLVAVNLQEPPQRIRATLDRLEWDLEVALDETGQVAGSYEARAIPQTVVIDPQGRIHRLFVGGGGVFLRNLEQSLRELAAQLD